MLVNEIFKSIQGESSYVGLPCVFVRLAGCNLECEWCDTPYARTGEGGSETTLDEVVSRVEGYRVQLVEITGGEPMLQAETPELARRLLALGRTVLMETNGSVALDSVPDGVVKVVDIKCPSSGFGDSFLSENLGHVTPNDEVKFVMADREDYEFARDFTAKNLTRHPKVLFAPVTGTLAPDQLASWILDDGLFVRLQVQVHRYVWNDERER